MKVNKVTLEYESGSFTITAKCNEDTEVVETVEIGDAMKKFYKFVDDATTSDLIELLDSCK